MSNILYQKPTNFAMVSYQALQDKRLSWKARGLYAFLVSKASLEGWKFSREALIEASDNDGKASYDSGIKELKDLGYLIIEPLKTEDGAFAGWKWTINNQLPELPKTGNTENREYKRSYIESSYIEKENTHTECVSPDTAKDSQGRENSDRKDIISFPLGGKKENGVDSGVRRFLASEGVKDDIPYEGILLDLVDKTGIKINPNNSEIYRMIRVLWRDGYTLENFQHVHTVKESEWGNDPARRQWLHPTTLYNRKKFDSYLLQEPPIIPGQEPWRFKGAND